VKLVVLISLIICLFLLTGPVIPSPPTTSRAPETTKPNNSNITGTISYTVRAGDYLFLVGERFSVPWQQIALANNITAPYTIYPNQTLIIPAQSIPWNSSAPEFLSASPSHPTITGTGSYTYRVHNGDHLSLIGLNLGVPWQLIAQINNISSPYVIFPGQQLVIPTNSSCSTANGNSVVLGSSASLTSRQASTSASEGALKKYTKYILLRFDDSFQDQWDYAVPILQKDGFKAVFATIVGNLNNQDHSSSILSNTGELASLANGWERMSWPEVQWLYFHGYEIADHTMTHPNLNSETRCGLNYEINYSKTLLEKHGIIAVKTLVLPYGAGGNNATVLSHIYAAGFEHALPADGVYPVGITNYTKMKTGWYSIDMLHGQSFDRFKLLANNASNATAVGFMFHHIDDHITDGATPYYVNVTNFVKDMEYLKSQNFTVIAPEKLPGY